MKTLKELFEVYRPKAKGEQDFVDKHVVIKHKDRNGNGDDVFNGNTKPVNRKKERHGYDAGADEKVYEETEELDEVLDSYEKRIKYIKKSGSSFDKGDENTKRKRYSGGKLLARNQMAKEEVEDLDEGKIDPAKSAKILADYGIGSDDIKKNKDGTHRFYRGFFYRSGSSSAGHAKNVSKGLDSYGIKHDVVDHGTQDYKPFKGGASVRTQNHHWVDVKIHPGQKVDLDNDYKSVKEDIDLDEAVSISHDRYLRSHGKKASGSGAWIFTHKKNGNIDLNDDKVSHIGKGKFSDAAKTAKAWAKKHGHTTVYVAEEHADEMLRNSILEMAELEGEDLTEENLDTLVEALLAEISKDLAARYADRASGSFQYAAGKRSNDRFYDARGKDMKDVMGNPKFSKRSPEAMAADDKTIQKRLSGLQKAHKTLAKEEVEELDELSSGTLKSYMKKSIHSSAAAWRDADGNVLNRLPKDASKTISKRYKGQSSAERKLAKEETEELEELSSGTLSSYADKARPQSYVSSGNPIKKRFNRIDGGVLAHAKMKNDKVRVPANEGVEDLDELSKGTLSSYVIKATHPSLENSISNLASKGGFKNASTSAGSDDDKDPNKNGEKEDSKAAKRSYGVIRAVSKLTKEDVINRTIEKYIVSEAELPTPTDRLLSKLDGLSEAHIDTLVTIFEGLNEDNQMKMLYTAESHEGILSLLDFAIQNKGA